MDAISSDVRKVLGLWGVHSPQSVRTPEMGTINTNLIVDASEGRFVLREYRRPDPDRISREHALVFWVHDQGFPSVPPLRTPTGDSWVVYAERIFALFPFVRGDQVQRADLRKEDAATMGRFLGRLHNALAAYPVEKVKQRTFHIDREETLSGIDRLERVIRDRKAGEPTDAYALERLQGRRAWVARNSGMDPCAIDRLRFQAIHGDYTESNLFFEQGEVVAIIDWDGVFAGPRSWEILRTMHLVFDFRAEPCRAFLKAYRTEASMAMPELEHCARCYSVERGYDLWLFEAIYEGGNDRLRRFLRPGAFVPIEERWSLLRPVLS